jgi:hypothetical protein
MGNFDVDIAGAADSLTGDVMVTVIVVVVVMSAWASNIVWGIKKRESGRGRTGRLSRSVGKLPNRFTFSLSSLSPHRDGFYTATVLWTSTSKRLPETGNGAVQ